MVGLGIVAAVLEISGMVNIGKAGVALNNNGVGINIIDILILVIIWRIYFS